jgi:hypothetical protein
LLREVDGAAAQARGVGGVAALEVGRGHGHGQGHGLVAPAEPQLVEDVGAALADLDRTGQVTGLAVAAAQGGEQLQPGQIVRALRGEVLQEQDRAVQVADGLPHP